MMYLWTPHQGNSVARRYPSKQTHAGQCGKGMTEAMQALQSVEERWTYGEDVVSCPVKNAEKDYQAEGNDLCKGQRQCLWLESGELLEGGEGDEGDRGPC